MGSQQHSIHSEVRVRVVSVAPPHRHVAASIQHQWLFAGWMAAAAAVAVVAGVVLGILAVLEVSVGGERWTQAVQAHGRLQLFGFVATFVVALALEFLPRLNQRPMFPAAVRFGLPALLLAGSLLIAVGQVWFETLAFLAWPGAVLFVAGSVGFAVLAFRVRRPFPLRLNPQPLFLQASAAWLAVASLLSLWSIANADSGVIPLDDSRLVIEVFLRGFVMLVIVGVALRAFVGHLRLEPVSPSRQFILLALLVGSLAVWCIGQLAEIDGLVRVADVVYGASILLATAWLPVLTRLRWTRSQPIYELLVPTAWLGAVVYAVLLGGHALAGSDLSLYQEGAIRHVFLLGFMVPLMVAMAHIVLARFGTGAIPWEPALTAAFGLAIVAWPLRVLPALLTDAPSDAGRAVMAVAGIVLMAALALVAAVTARTAHAVRQHSRG